MTAPFPTSTSTILLDGIEGSITVHSTPEGQVVVRTYLRYETSVVYLDLPEVKRLIDALLDAEHQASL